MRPKITVVTVCYNADLVLSDTLDSILSQSYSNFELVIKDGSSIDKTNNIIEKYRKQFEERAVSVSYISSADSGIYDAMNYAVQMATGEWIIFMNAGDCFADNEVLKRAADIFDPDACFAYGDTIDRLNGYCRFSKAGGISEITSRMPTSHQSVFTRRSYLLSHPFKQQYRLAADYDMLLQAYMNNEKFQILNFPVACYSRDGVSEIHLEEGFDEMKKIQQTYGLKSEGKIKRKYILIRVWARTLVRKYFPNVYYSEKRGWIKE